FRHCGVGGIGMNRRKVLAGMAAAAAAPIGSTADATSPPCIYMPAEWEPHARCVMSFCSAYESYYPNEVMAIRREQAAIANAIARFEPVTMLVNAGDDEGIEALTHPAITVVEMTHNDIWARDTLPIFGHCGNAVATGWNFNTWGGKFGRDPRDETLAVRFADHSGTAFQTAPIISEGGAMESDGMGTLLTTETCLLNANRNPGMSRAEVTEALKEFTSTREVIWLWGSEADTVTDGHVDGVARFIRPGLIVVELSDDPEDPEYHDLRENAARLRSARDARGEQVEVVEMLRPRWDRMPDRGDDFAASYVNAYFPNGGIVMSRFGDDQRDRAARDLFQRLEPHREIVQLDTGAIGEGGGGIHCTTMQIPA
ncbi:MAG: agmatine deiminase family protein, partial [Pseudomonadota bacterium]